MKKSGKIALCGMIGALSSIVMFFSIFPYLTYTMPALAGCFLVFIVIEMGTKWAFSVYAIVSAISLIMPEKEAAIFFILLFGYYPILKPLIEKLNAKFVKWLIKLIIFNVSAVISFYIVTFIFGIEFSEMGEFGRYTPLILLVAGNFAFILYDIVIDRLIKLYIINIRRRLKL